MIEFNAVSKRFALNDAKLVNQLHQNDPRVKGRFFNTLDDVSFHCKSGEVLGLLGANGAGKTTILRLLSTALTPDKGEVKYNGVVAHKNLTQVRKQIGFLSGTTGLYERLTGRENLAYFAKLFGLSDDDFNYQLQMISEQLSLSAYLDRRFSDYSTGMKQKLAIARAVIHKPKLVIFDEPTTGLDIAASEVVLNFMSELKNQGIPLIFSTHHLEEVKRLCDRVCIIAQGKNCFEGNLEQLKDESGVDNLQQAILAKMEVDAV